MVHVSVAELPAVIVVGEADSVAVGAAAACTVTVVAEVTVPPLPVAVNVYWVVADGLTVIDPEAATVPTPLLMETVLALVVVHARVTELPAVTLAGVAVREATGAAAELAGGVALLLPQPDKSPIQTHAATINQDFFEKHMFRAVLIFQQSVTISTPLYRLIHIWLPSNSPEFCIPVMGVKINKKGRARRARSRARCYLNH